MNRVFVDMDGVIVDFDGWMKRTGLTGDEVKKTPGAYLNMLPIEEGINGVRSLVGMGFEVWLATKPPTGIAFAYADKVSWVYRWLPEFKRRIIITHDKGLLGDEGDFLVDDRPHKANCRKFKGTLIAFKDGMTWPLVIDRIRDRALRYNGLLSLSL
jgi:5'-nucleotidase